MKPHKCILCDMVHETPYVLCPKHEALAVMLRKKDGLPIRQLPVLVVHDEPDD